MWDFRRIQKQAIGAVTAAVMLGITPAHADDITAGSVLERMNADERFFFMAGIVEGLAYARYKADGNQTEGMGCIYDWFYRQGTFKDAPMARLQIEEAFARYPNHTPGAVVGALTILRCGQ
ncbi:MAG: hypothetical protein Kilf2KO_34890 [Rhodospirillales bacterium]